MVGCSTVGKINNSDIERMKNAVAVGSLSAQWQRFEISNLIRKMLCKMPPNHRLKLTAHLANFVNARSLA